MSPAGTTGYTRRRCTWLVDADAWPAVLLGRHRRNMTCCRPSRRTNISCSLLDTTMQARWKHFTRSLHPRFSRNYAQYLPAERLHPFIRDFTCELSQTQPCFPLSSKDVSILSMPQEFRSSLLVSIRVFLIFALVFIISRKSMIRRARTRIFISSLYIGSSEKQLVWLKWTKTFQNKLNCA